MSRIVILSGGVGGARLVAGIAAEAPTDAVTVIVNTGDDFEHWGLRVCPDLDTVLYHLSGDVDFERGWGVSGDCTRTLDRVRQLGGPDWFLLGDTDLGTHVARTEALRTGASLTDVTRHIARAMGASLDVVPMCDHPAPTRIVPVGHREAMPFQDWFVRSRCSPPAAAVELAGGTPTDTVRDALEGATAVIIAPSNPFVSIEPILALDGVRDLVASRPVVAVSPIIGGRAVKGPLAEMLRDIAGVDATPQAVFDRLPRVDAALVHTGDARGVHAGSVVELDILMRDEHDRRRVARAALDAANGLREAV